MPSKNRWNILNLFSQEKEDETSSLRTEISDMIDILYQTEEIIQQCNLDLHKARWSAERRKLQNKHTDLCTNRNRFLNEAFSNISLYKIKVSHDEFVADDEIRLFREFYIIQAMHESQRVNNRYDYLVKQLKTADLAMKNYIYNQIADLGEHVKCSNHTMNFMLESYEQDYGSERLMQIHGMREFKEQYDEQNNKKQSALHERLKNAEGNHVSNTDVPVANITLGEYVPDEIADTQHDTLLIPTEISRG